MIIEISIGLAGLAIVLLTSLTTLKINSRLTKWGWILIILGGATLLLGIVQVISRHFEDNKNKNQFDLSDLRIMITAEYFNPKIPDSKILENIPSAFRIKYAFFAEQHLDISFERLDYVYRPTGYRSLNRIEVTYLSKNIEMTSPFNEDIGKLKYLWDLKGKTGEIKVPLYEFKQIGENDWIFASTLKILKKDYSINAEYKDSISVSKRNILLYSFK